MIKRTVRGLIKYYTTKAPNPKTNELEITIKTKLTKISSDSPIHLFLNNRLSLSNNEFINSISTDQKVEKVSNYNKPGIYRIISKYDNESYIGSSTSINRRINGHKHNIEQIDNPRRYNACPKLYNYIRKYG